MAGGTRRSDERVSATREVLLTAAERLFAERGVHAVTHRQISEAAGQGNIAAVNYHFGTKDDLVRAIARRHGEQIERRRADMVAALGDSTDLRAWVACLVRPVTEHLELLGSPTWYARFAAQIMADPILFSIVVEESLAMAPLLRSYEDGLARCLPHLPTEVITERAVMARHLTGQMCAERERALADGIPTYRPTWGAASDALIDAIVGLWRTPLKPGA
ncbi:MULTISPECIES: TetR/AcrR family transcriptional regulator [unclassified Streptomyces]|uniref:TetR/AcrR family transcriptional regulator n=1 Tax=unclassified Streptomyces TaxID=2593676 RepID=UPI0037167290